MSKKNLESTAFLAKKTAALELEFSVVEQANLVTLVDSEGITVGFYNTAKEALAAIPAIRYNLSKGRVLPTLLKNVIPEHCKEQVLAFRKNNRQSSNNNFTPKPRR